MMPGMIMLWYGSIDSVPSGWAYCDGTNGTPDLRGRFVCGAAPSVYVPGARGGDSSHSHTFTGDGHAQGFISGTWVHTDYPNGQIDHGTGTSPASGTTDVESHLPPYHCLCYIIKLPIS